ncbi:hypothetical protein ACF0H5_015639 [Mactra antiquata]
MLVKVSWKVYGTDSQYWQHMVDQLFPNSANYHSTINLIFKDESYEDCCLKESLRKQCNLLNCVYSIEISQHGLDSL